MRACALTGGLVGNDLKQPVLGAVLPHDPLGAGLAALHHVLHHVYARVVARCRVRIQGACMVVREYTGTAS